MQHIYTPEEYLNIERLGEELKSIDIETLEWPKKKPKASTIKTILDYSKALEIKPLQSIESFEQLMN